jgi:putative ABC transport system permease protein
MGSLLLRGFAQRKLRVALTALAVALGVALMAGTYILTDTINHSFAGIFQTANESHDVVISPAETLGRETRAQLSPLTRATLAQVRATPGVARAAGGIFSVATLLDEHGNRLTNGHAPSFVAGELPAPFESFSIQRGRFPRSATETAIDEATAKRNGLKLGQQIQIAGQARARRYEIVGIVQFGGGQSFGGAASAILVPAEAQRVVGQPGRFDTIDVAAAPGVSPTALRARLRATLPRAMSVRTGAQEAAKQTADLEANLSFLRTFLLVFAYVALFVGAFIIFNTFSITVAQRTREFALLRTLGAARGQIMRAVVAEGLMLGLLGSAAGLLLGLALAPALDQLFKALGADLPDSGTVLEPRTIVVSLAVGVVVTVLAGLAPAIRATRVPPLAAMREGVAIPPAKPSARALAVRFVVSLAVVVTVDAITGAHVLVPALLVFWTIRLVRLRARIRRGDRPPNYRLVPALGGAIGSLVSWRGITGRLARENAIRQPGRTLVTALALTIGIALVAFIAILAAGTKATIDQAVSRSFAGNLIVQNSNASGGEHARGTGIPAALAPALRHIPGVAAVTPVAFTIGRVHDVSRQGAPEIARKASITAVEPASFEQVYRVEWEHGSNATLLGLSHDSAVVSQSFAKAHKLKVGQALVVQTPADRHVLLTVRGISKDKARLLADLTIDLALARSAFGQREDGVDFVSYSPGADAAQVKAAVDHVINSQFPQAKSQTAAQFKQDQAEQIDTLLTLIYVLLALSVLVSLFGIVNTLILSIYERTHELGMMRAIGTTRRQIRQMIRYESVITALIGGVFGLVIGLVGAVLVATLALSGSGYVISIPVATLVVLLLVAGLAGVLAAQLPARRAARVDLLQAIFSE